MGYLVSLKSGQYWTVKVLPYEEYNLDLKSNCDYLIVTHRFFIFVVKSPSTWEPDSPRLTDLILAISKIYRLSQRLKINIMF